MAIDSTTRKQSFNLDGSTVDFDFTFWAIKNSPEDIKCKTIDGDGAVTDLTYSDDYTVSVNVGGEGGTVTLDDAGSSGSTLLVYRDTTNLQESDYNDFNQFPADTVEADFDRRTAKSQELEDDISRAVKASITSDLSDLELPTPEAGKAIVWNDDEDGLTNATIADEATVSSYATIAQNSATEAGSYATIAQGSVTTAASHATTALGAAEEAASYASIATEAGSYSTIAASHATTALGAATEASSYATIASGVVDTVSSLSTIASDAATEAGSYATIASDSVDAVASYSTIASDSADEAGSYATIASDASTEAGSYATIASDEATAAASESTTALGAASEASSYSTIASGHSDTAGSYATIASDEATAAGSHATTALGASSTAESYSNIALGATQIDATPDSDQTAEGIKTTLTAAEAMIFGDVGYINTASTVSLADADAIATAKSLVMCVDESIDASSSGTMLLLGVARNDSWDWTAGGALYLTTTATTGSTISQSAPSGEDDCVVVLGLATHADRVYFNPQLVIVEYAE